MIQLRKILPHILLPLAVGGLSALLTAESMQSYQMLNQPKLAPPGWLFPIVWTVLFLLMGVSAYRISQAEGNNKTAAYVIYAAQLCFNFFWSLIFFNGQWFIAAFVWLVILWILILCMILVFYRIDPLAAKLQIPYWLWVTFAGYLNLQIVLLNR